MLLLLFLVGCGTSSYKIQLIDASTDQPLANTRIELQAAVTCEIGAKCPEIALLKGVTDFNGIIRVPNYEVYRLVVLSDNFRSTMVRHDRDNPSDVYLDWSNEDGSESETKRFNVPEEIVVVKIWPRILLK